MCLDGCICCLRSSSFLEPSGDVSMSRVLMRQAYDSWHCVSDCSHSPSNLAVTRPRFVSPFKQFTCYPHCVHFNYMPSVSLAEGVHVGTRSAMSVVRPSQLHRNVRLTFIAFKTSRTPSKHRSLLAAPFGTTCDFSPLL